MFGVRFLKRVSRFGLTDSPSGRDCGLGSDARGRSEMVTDQSVPSCSGSFS